MEILDLHPWVAQRQRWKAWLPFWKTLNSRPNARPRVPEKHELKPGHERGSPGQVVGSLQRGVPALAKCVEPSRLSFPKQAPSFNPTQLLDEPHQTVFLDPVSQAADHAAFLQLPPRVRVHASKSQAFELLRFLDAHGRLRLVPEEKINKGLSLRCLQSGER